jgi:transposase-like protein
MAMLQHFDTLDELTAAFPDERSCIRHFRGIRWANGPFCPYCGSTKIYHFADDKTHKCGDCRQRFSIKVGTIFEDTKLPLRKWFIAIWLITSHKKGIASTQLARDVGVTQKTAWFMTHRLREAAKTKSFNKPLAGMVEIDETFVGGKERNKHEWKRQHAGPTAGKTAVFGMLERDGNLRAMKVDDLSAKTVQGKVVEHVELGSNIMSDESTSYIGLEGRFHHHTVNHSLGEYVRDYFCHVNGLEGAWSDFKRQVFGIHHWISAKHIDRYLDEFTWRYNRRDAKEGDRVNALLAAADGKRITYPQLIE